MRTNTAGNRHYIIQEFSNLESGILCPIEKNFLSFDTV